jgi:hypothetical protein
MEWDGNQWVDANSADFVPTPTQSRRDNTSSEKLDWDGSEWSNDAPNDWNTDEKAYYDDIGMEDPDEGHSKHKK